MSKVNKKDLENIAQDIQYKLQIRGVYVKITPYFSNGTFSYYFDIICVNKRKQLKTYSGTKKECKYYMYEIYAKVLDNIEYYESRSTNG